MIIGHGYGQHSQAVNMATTSGGFKIIVDILI